jgi:hypothetical protein
MLTDSEARSLVPRVQAVLGALGPLKAPRSAGVDAALAAAAATAAEVEADYQRRLRKWERDAPKREAAERAMEAANRRRGRASSAPVPVLASAVFERPQRPVVW